ncbi:hypothetical protein PRIPAC_89297 [Pristionchus pacificus]|uniref:Uncharacterized protein n=1 Tax=Pristionchus pacificus TaxID=54126 RepID=A0A2A6B6Q4_PRIPA|nr:hypothetical protein PRIPAC_89297 [Pristionchus pacificus]|eukprot:PDM61548.1 hypothetical protein PRIPAC_50990 [Pristionchus pacificus]
MRFLLFIALALLPLSAALKCYQGKQIVKADGFADASSVAKLVTDDDTTTINEIVTTTPQHFCCQNDLCNESKETAGKRPASNHSNGGNAAGPGSVPGTGHAGAPGAANPSAVTGSATAPALLLTAAATAAIVGARL